MPARLSGFSLIEVCIVTSLAALALALAVPGLSAVLERQRLRGAAADLAAELHWLRSEALLRNEALRFSLHSTAAGSCTIVHTGGRSDCRCDDSGAARCDGDARALKVGHWPAADRIGVQANVSSMLFDPDQGTVSPTGSIRIVDSRGGGITHVVNIAGRIRSCSPGATVSGFRAC